MYTGWRSLWEGVAKNLADMLGGRVPTLVTALVGAALAWAALLIPAADATTCAAGGSGGCVALAPAHYWLGRRVPSPALCGPPITP